MERKIIFWFFRIVCKLIDTPSSDPLMTRVIFIAIAIFLVGKLYFIFLRIPSGLDFEISFQVPLKTSWGLCEFLSRILEYIDVEDIIYDQASLNDGQKL